jgi:hypothetical protein
MDFLERYIFSRFGCPKKLVTDNAHVNFSKSQPIFSLADFSVKFKCQTQFQHCFSICYIPVFQYILTAVFHHMTQHCVSTSITALCFSICYSTVFQHLFTVVFQHMTQLCVSAYTHSGVSAYDSALCFNI